jgi:flagellar basal-body rod modification protein FlgD
MAAVSGLLNHTMTADQAHSGKTDTPAASANSSSGKSTSTSDAGTISSNDFLTLLVTEMKNQDPTATTDPNEYINQLVNVNSLQQLISINETLTADSASANTDSTTGQVKGLHPDTSAQPSAASAIAKSIDTAANKLAPGNIGVPAANPAASRIAQSLGGRSRVQ